MFENEYEFVKHYLDANGVNTNTAMDMACDIDIKYNAKRFTLIRRRIKR